MVGGSFTTQLPLQPAPHYSSSPAIPTEQPPTTAWLGLIGPEQGKIYPHSFPAHLSGLQQKALHGDSPEKLPRA